MNNLENIDCVGLQRKIRYQMTKEANFNIRKLVEMINEDTKDDKILKKYYRRIEKEKLLKLV
jgi:hypothetical protein